MFKSLVIIVFILAAGVWGQPYTHHEISLEIDPGAHRIQVINRVSLSPDPNNPVIRFLLHENLKLRLVSGTATLLEITEKPLAADFGVDAEKFKIPQDVGVRQYEIRNRGLAEDVLTLELSYYGNLHHPVTQLSQEYARGFSETPGIISEEGVYLAGSSYWLPWFNDNLVTANMTVTLPEKWRAVTQGTRISSRSENGKSVSGWRCEEPMDEFFLIAAQFTEYEKTVGSVKAMAFLRTPDDGLANKYLETTAQYLEMYRQLIGPYPYDKFALVENFWETGYGMPSFTLLGSKIIRFPFILHSSYPHELLHNWWGNGVFVDYHSGNWCEGFTVFLADHLIKEQRGQGAEYRRTALQAYTNYVTPEVDFPLSKFTSRHDAVTSAIGYNKSMMMFNMLRLDLGDDKLKQAIQHFYRRNKFKRAGFKDLKNSFELVSGKDLSKFFKQWVESAGAPELRLSAARVLRLPVGYNLNFDLEQIQPGPPYALTIPVAISLEGEKVSEVKKIQMTDKKQSYSFNFSRHPLVIEIDPEFDIFRRLHRNEIPPALSRVFGAERVLFVLPDEGSAAMTEAYRSLAKSWSSDTSRSMQIVNENSISDIPTDAAVWLFGANNKFRGEIERGIKGYSAVISSASFSVAGTETALEGNSILVTTRNPKNPEQVIVWLGTNNPQAVPGLGRKLPHYGKYSYLAFEGNEPTNILKGQWQAVDSPMRAKLNGYIPAGTASLPPRDALANLSPLFSEEKMMVHIDYLASEELAGRGLGSRGLDQSADYIAAWFKKAGLKPWSEEDGYFQTWEKSGGPDNQLLRMKNVIGILPGKKPEWEGQSVVISAHYDHLGLGWPDVRSGNEGKVHSGADDNASGVAVLIELAEMLGSDYQPERTIIFAAFTGEESGRLGSKYYIQNPGMYPIENVMGMLNLDTVGRLNGKKILVIGSNSASEWKHIAMGIGYVTGIKYDIVSQELDASDQVSFIEAGVPGIQIFSGPHSDYHRPGDTRDKIDSGGLVTVATFVKEALTYLAEREDAMSFAGAKSGSSDSVASRAPRRAGTGVMPEFAFSGEGVKIASVSDESPAALAGLLAGDIIIEFAGKKVSDLRAYSAVLKQFKPGDEVDVVVERNTEVLKLKITLAER